MIPRCWSFNDSRKDRLFLSAVHLAPALCRRIVTFNPSTYYSIRSAPTVCIHIHPGHLKSAWSGVLWRAKRIQETKMAYQNFMCNKDFHPSNIRNLKKVRKIHENWNSMTKSIILWKLLNTSDVRGWAASETGGEKAGRAEAAIHQGTRNIQIKVRQFEVHAFYTNA